MENNVRQDEGVSLLDILKAFWKRKITFIVSFGVVFLLVLVGMKCIYNPFNGNYTVTFRYEGTYGLEDGQYIDGSVFNYLDIISRENVEEIVKNNTKYSSIDIDYLYKDSSRFSITKNIVYSVETEENTIDLTEYIVIDYIITVPMKAFDDEEKAKEFIVDVINTPIRKIDQMIDDYKYDVYLNLYSSSISFEKQIAYLEKQADIINSGYDKYLSQYGDYVVNLGNTSINVSQLKEEFNSYINEVDFDEIKQDLELNGYVNDFEAEKEEYELMSDLLQNEITNLTALVTQLTATMTENTMTTPQALIDKTIALQEKKEEKIYVDKKITVINSGDKTDSELFAKRVQGVADKLEEYTNEYTSFEHTMYRRDLSAYSTNSSVLTDEGTFGTMIVLLASIVCGLIVGAIAVGIESSIRGKISKKEEEIESM